MSVYEFGRFQLNGERLTLLHAGKSVPLGRKVVETLLALVERSEKPVGKDELLERIWPEGAVEEANLSQNIYILRKTFRSYGMPDPIETIPRRGYRFTLPVKVNENVIPSLSKDRPELGEGNRRFTAVLAASIIAASLLLIANLGLTQHRSSAPSALSTDGTRYYQIGRYYWTLRTREGVRKSVWYFQHVVETDPANARGYAALADANIAMGDYCYGTHQRTVYFARAAAYAKKALTLDPQSSDAHAALGFVALSRHDDTRGIAELQRAIALDPSNASAREWYGIALFGRGDAAAGLQQLKNAIQLDPLSVATSAWLGSAAYVEKRFGDAIVYERQALELSPQRLDALITIGQAYEAQGQLDRAIGAFKQYGAIDEYYRPESAALLARAYAQLNRKTQARAELSFARAHVGRVYARDLVAAEIALGEKPERTLGTHSAAVENAAALTSEESPRRSVRS